MFKTKSISSEIRRGWVNADGPESRQRESTLKFSAATSLRMSSVTRPLAVVSDGNGYKAERTK